MRTILVTGASDGIGRALAVAYARRGDRVLGVARRPFVDALAGVIPAGDYCVLDLAAEDAPARLGSFLAARGIVALDVLIHNAAIGWYGSVAAQEPASIDRLLSVNLYAPISMTHALLDRVRAGRGVIAFVSSIHSVLPAPDFAVYTATKAALDGFARSLRVEERGRADVVVVWPGPTRTQMHMKSGVPPNALRAARFSRPEVVAAAAMAAIDRRRSRALGAANQLLRAAAAGGEGLLDGALLASGRRRAGPRPLANTAPHAEAFVPGRHAVVTGAAEGIGRALVDKLAAQGYAITGVDVNAAGAARVQEELAKCGFPATFFCGDLGTAADVTSLAGELAAGPAMNVLVHNAGINHVAPFGGSDFLRQRAVLDVNLRAPLQLTAALLRADKLQPGSTIVFLSSLSHFASYPGAAVYAATKDGLASYARSLAVALAPHGIDVAVVYPGPTRTAHARRYSPDNRREHRRMAPEAVAAAIVHAIVHRRRVVIPGFGNRLWALAGRWAPGLVERGMKRAIYDRLTPPDPG